MNDPSAALRTLAARLDRLAEASSPSTAFKILLEASSSVAPRAAVYLVRQGEVRGWNAVGYDQEATTGLRQFRSRPTGGWLSHLVSEVDGVATRGALDERDPAFGQPEAYECVGGVVRLHGQPMALIVAERAAGEQPWVPEGLKLLVRVVRMRLELDVALRKLDRLTQAAAGRPAPTVQEAAPAERPVATAPRATAPVEQSAAVEPAPAVEASPDLDAARRYAKLVATDIRLYNEQDVMNGRRDGDLASRLSEHLGRGKQTFLKRHGDLGPTAIGLLHEAYVNVLAGGDPSLIPPSALD